MIVRLRYNKEIAASLGREMEKDGWTLSKLATAQPKDLTTYKGVGFVKARRIIKEAQEAVNEQSLAEAKKLDPPPDVDTPELDPEEPPASARIMRLREAAKKNA